MELLKTLALFVVTALAEIIGCYLPYAQPASAVRHADAGPPIAG
jgi:drug/metabolite transporter superfamily protein YnfA